LTQAVGIVRVDVFFRLKANIVDVVLIASKIFEDSSSVSSKGPSLNGLGGASEIQRMNAESQVVRVQGPRFRIENAASVEN